ncbi:hypothetical protein SDC9_193290 [bioreactor metagenome]|uniref:Uncharacterized protein n=1 Tax=bioreactor metagenome TaxID=1076179 RepID=A0A645I3N0_9ZZZZ
MRRRQIFQRIQRFFRLAFLNDTHNSIQNNNQKNQNRLKKTVSLINRYRKRYNGSGYEDQDHNVFKLSRKALQACFFLFFMELVFTILSKKFPRFIIRETVYGVCLKLFDYMFQGVVMHN